MASEISASFDIDTTEFTAATADMQRIARRATMYALRRSGRFLVTQTRTHTPVYPAAPTNYIDARVQVKALWKALANARQMPEVDGMFQLKVGPFGGTAKAVAVTRHGVSRGNVRGVPLYRGAMEEKYHYMEAGLDALEAEVKSVFEEAYGVGLAKYTK